MQSLKENLFQKLSEKLENFCTSLKLYLLMFKRDVCGAKLQETLRTYP